MHVLTCIFWVNLTLFSLGPALGPAEYFTIEHGWIQTDPMCRHTTLLTSCEPECCLQAEPCAGLPLDGPAHMGRGILDRLLRRLCALCCRDANSGARGATRDPLA